MFVVFPTLLVPSTINASDSAESSLRSVPHLKEHTPYQHLLQEPQPPPPRPTIVPLRENRKEAAGKYQHAYIRVPLGIEYWVSYRVFCLVLFFKDLNFLAFSIGIKIYLHTDGKVSARFAVYCYKMAFN